MTVVCGFIGLGDQGSPIARRIVEAGHPLLIWARRVETLQPFNGTPAEPVATIAALGERADHVGICVKGEENVREVCKPLIASMRRGSRIALHSTTLPATSADLARQAAERDIMLVDAPVSGGRPAAEAGKLTVMVGGKETAVAAMRPVFETFAALILHFGDVGTGQAAKLLNNSLLGAGLGAAHLALAAGKELGLDSDALIRLLGASSGRSFAFDVYARQQDLSAFVRRLSLFDQIGQLETVLGGGHPACRLLRGSATPLFAQR